MSTTLRLTKELITRPSVTPEDAGCQLLLSERLEALGFRIEPMAFGGVDNFWARRGSGGPVLALAGHTDVVPPGPLSAWQSDPFQPSVRHGRLYGRGAADMKGSLAAMITALESFVQRHPNHDGSLAMLVTSDEEGPAVNGTARVMDTLAARGERIDYCLVGEPSSEQRLGDTIKNGRRGSLSGELTGYGRQGHVAYPQLADNPVHRLAPALAELCATTWDHGSDDFPPTSFQISNLQAGTGATNVIPGEMRVSFNYRYSPQVIPEQLRERVEAILERHGVHYELEWTHSAEPFLTPAGPLVDATRRAVTQLTGERPRLSTTGGTSDGRFIAPTGAEVVELGPVNASIHQADEWVDLEALDQLSGIYDNTIERLLGRSS